MRRNSTTTVAVLLAALCLAATSTAQITKRGSGYLFQMKWETGQVLDYRMMMSTQIGGSAAPTFSMDYKMTVGSVRDGVADVTVSSTSPGSNKPQSQTIQMGPRGPIKDESMVSNIGAPRLPDHAIKIGGSWTASVDRGNGKMHVDSTYVFKGLKKIDGIQCAEIDVTSVGTGVVSSKSTGTIYLMTKNGQAYKMSMVTNIVLGTGAQQKNATSTITIQLK